jgi:AcrR family transcriptional regulator
VYALSVPKLWTQTIETHRREVGEAILDTTAALVAEHGLRAVTMSQIAEQAGIGRATLYKYFPDVESILVAWHERQVAGRLALLAQLRDEAGGPDQALESVLRALAAHMHEGAKHGHGTDLHALVHQDRHIKVIEQQLRRFVRDLIAEAAKTGHVRTDIPPDELASYCLHAISAAANTSSRQAVQRLVDLTLAGLHPIEESH